MATGIGLRAVVVARMVAAGVGPAEDCKLHLDVFLIECFHRDSENYLTHLSRPWFSSPVGNGFGVSRSIFLGVTLVEAPQYIDF